MKKSKWVRALSMLLSLLMVAGVFAVLPVGTVASSAAGLTSDELAGILGTESYEVYASRYTQILGVQTDRANANAQNMPSNDLFRAAGVPKDEEKLRYYILLDELN